MMAIFLPHIYSRVKYETGQSRKNFAVVECLECTYHREVSLRVRAARVLFCRGKVGGVRRPAVSLGLRANGRLHVWDSRPVHAVAIVKLTALTRAGWFNNMRYNERRKKSCRKRGECGRGWGKPMLGSVGRGAAAYRRRSTKDSR